MYELTEGDHSLLNCVTLPPYDDGFMECFACSLSLGSLNVYEHNCQIKNFKEATTKLLIKMKIFDERYRWIMNMNQDNYMVINNEETTEIEVKVKFSTDVDDPIFLLVAGYDYKYNEGYIQLCYSNEQREYKKFNDWRNAVEKKFKLIFPKYLDLKEVK